MFTITVSKLRSDKTSQVSSSHRQALIDHLKASTERNGFVLAHPRDTRRGDVVKGDRVIGEWESGDIFRDGILVATWELVPA